MQGRQFLNGHPTLLEEDGIHSRFDSEQNLENLAKSYPDAIPPKGLIRTKGICFCASQFHCKINADGSGLRRFGCHRVGLKGEVSYPKVRGPQHLTHQPASRVQDHGGNFMKLSYVFIFNTIAALGYGVGLLIIPGTVLTWHGISADSSTILMARYFAVALFGIGLVTWLARDSDESNARDALTIGLPISYIIGFGLSLQATLTGQMSALGWLPVVVYLLLIVGFGYFRFR